MLSIVMLIVDTVAVLLGGVLLLRFWMQATRVRPPSSVAQFTFQLSDWLVRPMRRLVPGVGGYDWASLLGAFLIVVLATSVRWFAGYPFDLIMLMALHRFLQWILYGFMILLVIEAIFSWVNPHAPLAPFVRALNEPILKPVRRVVPLVGNLDLSLLVALVLLQVAQIVLEMVFR